MYKVNCSPFLYIIDKVSHTGINQLTIQSTYSLVTLLQLYPQHQSAGEILPVLQTCLQKEQTPQVAVHRHIHIIPRIFQHCPAVRRFALCGH